MSGTRRPEHGIEIITNDQKKMKKDKCESVHGAAKTHDHRFQIRTFVSHSFTNSPRDDRYPM